MRVEVVEGVIHSNGEIYGPGKEVDLDDKHSKSLIKAGVVKDPKAVAKNDDSSKNDNPGKKGDK